MKKFGFTLAEVLITLGIIGVVAALTLPSLYIDTQGAQVGPRLGKAVAMFEQANQSLLSENNVDSLSDIFNTGVIDSAEAIGDYMDALGDFLKVSKYNGDANYNPGSDDAFSGAAFNNPDGLTWQSKDGVFYFVNFWNEERLNVAPHRQTIGAVVIDINGETTPNIWGTDIFAFRLMDDGSLTPAGQNTWQEQCPNDEVPTAYSACTASIFANNMKVMYKMR